VPSLLQGLDHTVDHLLLGGTGLAPLREVPDQFGLSIWADLAITRKRRRNLLVSQILAPGLELLWCPACALADEKSVDWRRAVRRW